MSELEGKPVELLGFLWVTTDKNRKVIKATDMNSGKEYTADEYFEIIGKRKERPK